MSLFAIDISEGESNDIEKPMPIFLKRHDNDVLVKSKSFRTSPKKKNDQRRRLTSKSVENLSPHRNVVEKDNDHSAADPVHFEMINSSSNEDQIVEQVQTHTDKPVKKDKDTKNDKYIIDQNIPAITSEIKEEAQQNIDDKAILTESKIYVISRDIRMRINGKSTYFVMKCNGQEVHAAKYKQKYDIIPIFKELKNTHFSSKATDYVINVGQDKHDFSLRIKSRIGRELLSIRYFTNYDSIARNSILTFYSISNPDPYKLFSLNYLGNKLAKQFQTESVKNAIYAPKNEENQIILVKKSSKNELTIESKLNLDPIYAFALAISAYLCSIT